MLTVSSFSAADPPAVLSVNPGGPIADNSSWQRPKLATVCGLHALAMVITAGAICGWGYSQGGTNGLAAGVIAVAVCWICSAASLVIGGLLAGTPMAMHGQLGGILLKTMLPLAAGTLLSQNVPWLREANVFGMMVPAYLVSLVVVTALTLWLVGPIRPSVKAKAL
jgi:hypothetical protein